MKHRLWILTMALLVVTGFLTTGCDQLWGDEDGKLNISSQLVCGTPKIVPLIAGQNDTVGIVRFWNCTTQVCVEFQTIEGWYVTEYNLVLANSIDEFPQNKNGVLIPGHFPYKKTYDAPGVMWDSMCVPLGDWEPGDTIWFAGHFVVNEYEGEELLRSETGWGGCGWWPFGNRWARYCSYVVQECYKDISLPTTPVRFKGTHYGPSSYWGIELAGVPSGYDIWDGTNWVGWCAEKDVYIRPGVWFTVQIWSSQDPLLPARAQNANWDLVNYLLNNKHPSATIDQVQNAIWYLLGILAAKPGGYAGMMVDDAIANGEGFRPATGDWIAAILLTDEDTQLIFIEVDP